MPTTLSATPYRYHHDRYYYGYNHCCSYHGHYGPRVSVGAGYRSRNNTLGYIFLGLLGLYVIHEIFDDDGYERHSYPERVNNTPSQRVIIQPKQVNYYGSADINQYYFGQNEGWEALDNQNYLKAMRIFAIQSQQNLSSGVPKIGFALATAANGELERGIWSMQRALKQDPNALEKIRAHNHSKQLLNQIHFSYEQSAQLDNQQSHFMMAAISYMNNEFMMAAEEISLGGNDLSTNKLATIIDSKIN